MNTKKYKEQAGRHASFQRNDPIDFQWVILALAGILCVTPLIPIGIILFMISLCFYVDE